jgi:hypothetical protein
MLSEWISGGEHKDLFCRSPASGAKATIHFKLGTMYSDQAGDIIATGEKGFGLTSKFFLECKHYGNLNLEGFIYKTKSGLPEFWTKACKEAKEHNKLPMLIARQNNKPIILCLNTTGLELFQEYIEPIAFFPVADLHIFNFEEFLSETLSVGLELQSKTSRYKLVQ